MRRTMNPIRKLNPVSSARELINIVRELSLDDLRNAALRSPRIVVVGRTITEARHEAERLFGPEARDLVVAADESDAWPRGADIVLIDRRARAGNRSGASRVIEFSHDEPEDRIRQQLFRSGDDIEMALGRAFPALRQPAAMYVINATARANAQFALASNIPALVPVVGGLLSVGADTIVLTKNQLMMIYKLAAINGRDIDNRFQIYREMIPVVGAGLFWRTVARDLAAMVPFAAGAVPKVAIAFAGTFAAGMAAQVYYLEGKRASSARMRAYYGTALRELRNKDGLLRTLQSLPGTVRDGHASAASPTVIEADYRSDVISGMA